MRKYIYHFDTEADFNEMRSAENYDEPWVSLTEDVERIDFNKTEEEKERERLKFMPLTFEIHSDGEIRWKSTNTGNTKTIEYSKNEGETWTEITSASGDSAPSISVVSGETIQFRGNNTAYGTSYSNYKCFSGTTCSFSAKGNIMSLINSTDFANLTTLESASTFYCLFRNCSGLTDASNLLLPATTLASQCYDRMFIGCTSLTTAPALPATTLTSYCYQYMFQDCNSLTGVPSNYLPATNLSGASACYMYMFSGCTSLTSVPALPATTLATSCYSSMFRGCTSLTQAPALPASALTKECYREMFAGCTILTTAPVLPTTTLASYCYSGMFSGCTSLITAPALPSPTLATGCYEYMFSNCTNLTSIKCLATDISATSCRTYWVSGVASTGTFIKAASMSSWSTGVSGIPSGWTVQDAS